MHFLERNLSVPLPLEGGRSIDTQKLLDGGILLARLSQGLIGAENAHMLGALILSKLHQAAFGRVGVRKPFFLYLDEGHHFATPSLASLLSGARKYGVGVVFCASES